MKELEVYVRSYALGKTGIHWRKIENGESILGYPQILEQRIIPKKTGGLGTIEYRINYQKLSFVLMRHSQQLLFLVGGIEAPEERSNQLGSTIFNAVAWVVNPDESNSISPKNELTLRHLAARSLLSFVGKDPEFINTINEAINFNGLEEFSVDFNIIHQLPENLDNKLKQLLLNLDKAELDNAEDAQQIWDKKDEILDNEQEIISLADKIIKTGLSKGDDLAILISKVDEKNAVSVLSIDLKPEISTDNQVQEVTTSLKNIVENQEVVKNTPGKERKQILLLMVLIVSLLMIILFSLKTMENQKEKPEKIPIPQTLINPWPSSPVTLTNTKI
jgi:hypothetical protein